MFLLKAVIFPKIMLIFVMSDRYVKKNGNYVLNEGSDNICESKVSRSTKTGVEYCTEDWTFSYLREMMDWFPFSTFVFMNLNWDCMNCLVEGDSHYSQCQ